MVKTLPSDAGDSGLISGWRAKVSHALWPEKTKHKTATILQKIQ